MAQLMGHVMWSIAKVLCIPDLHILMRAHSQMQAIDVFVIYVMLLTLGFNERPLISFQSKKDSKLHVTRVVNLRLVSGCYI